MNSNPRQHPLEDQLREYFAAITPDAPADLAADAPLLDLVENTEGDTMNRRWIWIASTAAAALLAVGLVSSWNRGEDTTSAASTEAFATITVDNTTFRATERVECRIEGLTVAVTGRGDGPDGNRFIFGLDARTDEATNSTLSEIIVEGFGPEDDQLTVDREIHTSRLRAGSVEARNEFVYEIDGTTITGAGLFTTTDGEFFTIAEAVPFTFTIGCGDE